LLAFVLKGDPKLAITVLLLGIVAPVVTVKFMAARRRKKFVSQLPDTLTLLAGTLKAGYSFMQGLESVSRESEDPIAEELRKVVTEAQLGRPVEEALDMSADRMSSDDYAWAIMAVKIQREVGGNLSELLMTVAETMTARERLRRDVASLTAEGRISAIVLGFLPFGLGAVMYVINPGYVGLLFSETVGNIMLGAGFVGAMIGFLWMKKLITIEI
ncbi:MAG: type II secretion system F family protein, partial [Acidimicrobiia bacterium]|nr:type II secretion system F family protein [Acidimicrobiia bacterium]